MVDRVVVAVRADDDSSRDAVALGADLARILDAGLTVGGVWVDRLGPGGDGQDWALDKWMREILDRVCADIPADLDVDKAPIGAASVNRGISELAERVGADLLVLGPSHLGRMGRLLRGDIALHSIQDAPCAVVAAPPGYHAGGRLGSGELLVAWDGSDESRQALEAAIEMAQATGATLLVVHVLETPYRYSESPDLDEQGKVRWRTSERPNAERLLEAALGVIGDRVAARTELLDGIPGTELAAASLGARAVFIGSRSLGGLERVALGSTSAQLLHHAAAPVFVTPRSVREPEATPPVS